MAYIGTPEDAERYQHACDGFSSMFRHRSMTAGEVEALQKECSQADSHLNGPSILRSVEVWFQGWKRYRDSTSPYPKLVRRTYRDSPWALRTVELGEPRTHRAA